MNETFRGGYVILNLYEVTAYATGSASAVTVAGLYARAKQILSNLSKPVVLHGLVVDISGTATPVGDTFVDRYNVTVDSSKVEFYVGVGVKKVKVTITSANVLTADVTNYGSGSGAGGDLSDLSDVDVTEPSNNQSLIYMNGSWINRLAIVTPASAMPSILAFSWDAIGKCWKATITEEVYNRLISGEVVRINSKLELASDGSYTVVPTLFFAGNATNAKMLFYTGEETPYVASGSYLLYSEAINLGSTCEIQITPFTIEQVL